MSSWDDLFKKILQIAGVDVAPTTTRWNIVSGASAVFNPATGATDITLTAADGGASMALQDVSALRAIGPGARADKQSRLVEDLGQPWRFDTATGANGGDDGETVTKPTDVAGASAGRWWPAIGTRFAIGTALLAGLVLQNPTAAGAGAQQNAPAARMIGQGWKTNATAASQPVEFAMQVRPVQGAANPSGELHFLSQINTGGYTSRLILSSGGVLTLGNLTVDGGAAAVTFTVAAGATSVGWGQAQHGSGAGVTTSFRGQKGFAGFVGGDFIIGGGDGGTPGTQNAGNTIIELGQVVGSTSAKLSLRTANTEVGFVQTNGYLTFKNANVSGASNGLSLESTAVCQMKAATICAFESTSGNVQFNSGSRTFTFFALGALARQEDLHGTGANTIQWQAGCTSITDTQADNATNSVTGAQRTLQAQNATGTTSTGGKLSLVAGTGSSRGGNAEIVGGAGTTNGAGGDVVVASGAKAGSGIDGSVLLKTGGSAGTTRLNVTTTTFQLLACQQQWVKNSATFNSTTVFDFTLGNLQVVTLTGNITTLTLSNMKDGGWYLLVFIQDGTGSRTLAVPSNLKPAGGAFVLTTGGGSPNKRDQILCWSDGTNLYEMARAMNV